MDVPLDTLDEFVEEFVEKLPPAAGAQALVFALKGDLGSGKTTFVQHVARRLGVKEKITSPTFVIAQSYDTTHPIFSTLAHIDAYRLEDETKDTIGFSEIISDPNTLVFVEWPQLLPGGLPKNTQTIQFETIDKNTRRIKKAS